MNTGIKVIDLGQMDYQAAWDIQKDYLEEVILGVKQDTLFFVEHEPVYTLGKNADEKPPAPIGTKRCKSIQYRKGG